MTDDSDREELPPRIELYVRSLAPADIRETQEEVLERLQALEADGQIAEFEVVVCGEAVCPSSVTAETAIGRRLLDRYRSATEWANEHGRELIGFESRETESEIAGTAVTGVSFPRLLLVELDGGDVEYVAPSRDDSETTSVQDRIERYVTRT